MSDLYSEILVKRQPGPADTFKKAGLIICVLLSLAGGILITPFLFLAAIGFGVAIWLLFPKFKIEYEYLILNKELDVDVIYSQQKRKKAAQYDLDSMDLLAPLKSHRMEYYNGNTQLKVQDFTSGREDITPYAMITKDQGSTVKVLLELDQETVDKLRRTYPNRVFLD